MWFLHPVAAARLAMPSWCGAWRIPAATVLPFELSDCIRKEALRTAVLWGERFPEACWMSSKLTAFKASARS